MYLLWSPIGKSTPFNDSSALNRTLASAWLPEAIVFGTSPL